MNQPQTTNRRPHILVFTGFFAPHKGGVENYIYEVYRRLTEFEVTVVTVNTEAVATREVVAGLSVIRLPGWNFVGRSFPVPKPNLTTFRLLKELWFQPVDLVNTHTRFFLTSLVGLLWARLKHRPLLHTEHGSGRTRHASWFVELVEWFYDLTFGRLIMRRATKVIGVSAAAAQFAQDLGAHQPVEVVYNGVDTDQFRVKQTHRSLDDPLTITYIGRLMKAKGPDLLIRAIQKATSRLKLVMIGDGPLMAELRHLVGQDLMVELLGAKERSELPNYLAKTEIFVLPTTTHPEGLPTSVLEAGAAGLAVIATDIGGTREVIQNEQTGLLIPANDEQAMTKALDRLAADRSFRRKLAYQLETLVHNRFDWSVLAPQYRRQLRSLL